MKIKVNQYKSEYSIKVNMYAPTQYKNIKVKVGSLEAKIRNTLFGEK